MRLTCLAVGVALSVAACGGSSSSNQPSSDAGVGGSGGSGGIGGIGALTQFNGLPVEHSTEYVAGDDLSIETVFGNVRVEQSPSTQVEVVFLPFDFLNYDQKDQATKEMNENLHLEIQGGGDISIKAERTQPNPPGLGADITVRLPTLFDGKLTILNHGEGPVNHFDTDLTYVASATALDITSQSTLAECKVQGAATVVDTNVECGREITVLDVADNVHLTLTEGNAFDEPSMILRLSAISSGSTGGSLATPSGPIEVTFPASASFSAEASAPSGAVDAGVVPASCTLTDTSDTAKSVSCGGSGPTYTVSTQGENGGVFAAGTIYFKYQ